MVKYIVSGTKNGKRTILRICSEMKYAIRYKNLIKVHKKEYPLDSQFRYKNIRIKKE